MQCTATENLLMI